MLRAGLTASCCALAIALLGLLPGGAGAQSASGLPGGDDPRVVLAFLPARERPLKVPPTIDEPPTPTEVLLERLDRRDRLALGLVGATQGPYTQEQALLDLTQGTRTSIATYDTKRPWPMRLAVAGTAGFIDGWVRNRRRALGAPASTDPGLLASSIPGGGTYVGYEARRRTIEAVAAADQQGTVRRVFMGSPQTIARRTEQMLVRHRYVVASLPQGRSGGEQLDQLIQHRRPQDLLIVMQAPPELRAPQLLPVGIAGLKGGARGMISDSTRQPGIVAGIDLAPTILRHLRIPVPDDMRGEAIRITDRHDGSKLEDTRERFTSIGKYRLTTVQGMVLTWIGVLLGLTAFGGWHRRFRKGLRIGALSFMWAPVVALFEANFNPATLGVEMALVALPSFALGWLTERFVPWPRGPAVPIFATLALYTADLANDSHLIVRSLLGPNPKFGSRFFGVGNELEALLPVLLLIGLACLFTNRERSRKLAAVFGVSGLVLAGIIGSGRLGADVGGVMTVAAGTAVATLMMLPRRPRWWVLGLAALTPFLALGGLALLDLATGGNSHFTRNVLSQDSGNFADVLARRFELAFNALFNGRRMPFVVAAGAIAVTFAYRNRRWLYGPVDRPAWRAALVGGLVTSVAGSLFNDSGPLLFVVGAFCLVVTTAYIQGDPRLEARDERIAPRDDEDVPPTEARRPPPAPPETPPTEREPEPVLRSPSVS